jgi:hypothetical protein
MAAGERGERRETVVVGELVDKCLESQQDQSERAEKGQQSGPPTAATAAAAPPRTP